MVTPNTIELVGLAGIFSEDREDVSFPDTMMLLLVDERRIDKRFLERVLLSARGRSQIQRIAAGTSGSMKKINRSGLQSLQIPVPPLETQKKVIMSLDACADARRTAETKCKNDQELKAALLKHLLDH